MIIKNNIKDLGYMFKSCKNLTNIEELKYLDVKYCSNFSYMFSDCSSLADIKPLEKWNVSNGTNFPTRYRRSTIQRRCSSVASRLLPATSLTVNSTICLYCPTRNM